MHTTGWKRVVKIISDLILLKKKSGFLNRKEQKEKAYSHPKCQSLS